MAGTRKQEERRTTCNIVRGFAGARLELRADLRNADEVAEIINILEALCEAAFDQSITHVPVDQEEDEDLGADELPHDANGVETSALPQ